MKNWIIILFFVPVFAHSQTTHTVAPKETLYSLARKYNIHPKELAAFNNIPVETGLTIGQVIKIPAKTNMPALQTAPQIKPEPVVKKSEIINERSGIPVFHKVAKKETLYHISKLYPGLTVDEIKKWNKLTSDGVSEGTDLIVGYKKGKKDEPVAIVPVKEAKTVPIESQKQISSKEKTSVQEKTIDVEARPILPQTTTPAKEEVNKITGKKLSGGFFKTLYTEQTSNKDIKEETGTAAIFKSTSGWEDGKYYCLHNKAPAGSIVKITNKNTQKSVYAKVLDVIPDLKQNSGILIRLSNAAADELGAGENNFEAVLNY